MDRPIRMPRTAWMLFPLLLLGALLSTPRAALPAEQPAAQTFPFRFYPNRGGDFTLTDQHGRPWEFQSTRGRVVLLTFGYTHCPDICPTALATLGAAERELGGLRESVRIVFVTLDPARDTPERLTAYLANFEARMVGLTGTEDAIRAVARQYNAKYVQRDGGPNLGVTIDHTAFIYLVDPQGRLRYLFPHVIPPDHLAEAVRQLLKSAP